MLNKEVLQETVTQLKAENERLKEALMKIYTLDVKCLPNDLNHAMIVKLRIIADKALKGE